MVVAEEQLLLSTERFEQETVTAEQLINKLSDMIYDVKSLSFGAYGTGRSTGPCADSMEELTAEMECTIQQMVATMREFLAFVRQGAQNIQKADEMETFLAKTTTSIGIPPPGAPAGKTGTQ